MYIEDTNSLKVEITFKIEIIMTKTTLRHFLLLNVKIYCFSLWASTYAKIVFLSNKTFKESKKHDFMYQVFKASSSCVVKPL